MAYLDIALVKVDVQVTVELTCELPPQALGYLADDQLSVVGVQETGVQILEKRSTGGVLLDRVKRCAGYPDDAPLDPATVHRIRPDQYDILQGTTVQPKLATEYRLAIEHCRSRLVVQLLQHGEG
ncbi:hypothetical protein D9M71_200810 [compost metagenome]